jgi:hypothetical protein
MHLRGLSSQFLSLRSYAGMTKIKRDIALYFRSINEHFPKGRILFLFAIERKLFYTIFHSRWKAREEVL